MPPVKSGREKGVMRGFSLRSIVVPVRARGTCAYG